MCASRGFQKIAKLGSRSREQQPGPLQGPGALCLVSFNGEQSVGAVFKNLTTHQVKGFKIPLPPLEVQRTIVAELGEERAAVDHAQRLASKMEQRIQGVITRVWEG